MFAELAADRGRARPVQPKKSVAYVQKVQSGPKSLFITEYDKVWPDESDQPAEPAEKDGKPAKKKKKKADDEWKSYPHHKYGFAKIGHEKNDSVDNILLRPKNSEPGSAGIPA